MTDKRDDDITDLTGDKGANGNGKDKGKDKKKNEKEAAQTVSHQENAKKTRKNGKIKDGGKGGKGKLKLILIIAPISFVVIFIVLLLTNLFGFRFALGKSVKKPLIGMLTWFDPEYNSVDGELRKKYDDMESGLNKREAELDKREEDISGRETEINDSLAALDKRGALLDRRSTALDRLEEQINQTNKSTVPAFRRELSPQELEDMQSLSRTYAQMNPATAAGILGQMKNDQEVSTIIYYMVERNAAAIMAEMDPGYAAKITDILLSG